MSILKTNLVEAIMATKNTFKKVTICILLSFSLQSCSLFDKQVLVDIPQDVLNLPLQQAKQENLLENEFNPTNVDNKLYNKINDSNEILVLPYEYLEQTAPMNSYTAINFAFNSQTEIYVGVKPYFQNTSNNLNLDFKIGIDANSNYYYSKFKFVETAQKFIDDNKSDLLLPYLIYDGLNNYKTLTNINLEELYDSNNDGYIDSIFFMPFLNLFSKSTFSETLKNLLTSKTFTYTSTQADQIKSEIEEYTNRTFDFTISTASFSSFYYLTEVNDLYKVNGLSCYNHQFIYEIARQFNMSNLQGNDETNPLGMNFLSSGMVGDIDAFNKIKMGLTTPYIINSEGKYELKQDSNYVYLIPKQLNYNINSIYDEYLLITYYDGMKNPNIHKDTGFYSNYVLNNKSGFIVFACDNRLQYLKNNLYQTLDTQTDSYDPNTEYVNVTSQKVENENYLVQILDENNDNSILKNGTIKDSDFFTDRTSLFVNTFINFTFSTEIDYKLYFQEANEIFYLYLK